MSTEMCSLDEMMEQEFDNDNHNSEDEQVFVNAALSESPTEDCRFGFYNGKPKDLVSLFNENLSNQFNPWTNEEEE